MRRGWALSGMMALILAGALIFSHTSTESSSDISSIKKNLTEQGVTVNSISGSDDKLTVEIQSEGTDQVTSADIQAIRDIRNQVRSESNKSLGIKDLNVQIAGKQGNIIYDGTINDITAIPAFVTKPEVKLDAASVKKF